MALTGLTKIQKVGINTATIPTVGGVEGVGVITATNFIGDGSGLTGVTGSGAGVIVRDGGSLVGTAGTINFGTNLNVSAISAGIVTVTNAASATALTNLSDVTITSASNGQILKHNGSVFVNVAETDTTYSQSSVASGSNVNLRLTDSDGTNDDILITAGSNITFSSVSAGGFTIAASGGGGGSGISSVFEDTTPRLGGSLDLNNKFITGSGGINVSGVVTATSFVGNITGNVTGNTSGSSGSCTGNSATATEATNVTVTANNSTDETVYPIFVDGATGGQGAESDTGLNYNPSTGNLTATKFTGSGVALTGVVTSIVAGANITLTGGPTGIVTIASSGGGGGGSGLSLANGVDNRVVTATGSTSLNGETNLTWDGTTLAVVSQQTVSGSIVVGSATTISGDGINVTGVSTFGNTVSVSNVLNVTNDVNITNGIIRRDNKLWLQAGSGDPTYYSGTPSGSAGDHIFKTHSGGFTYEQCRINLHGVKITGVCTATTFIGNLTGTATTATNVTVADESSDTSCNVLFTTAATGNLPPKTGTNLTFNSSSGALTAGSFVKDGGSSSQFLKADGSIDSNTYLTSGSYLEHVADDNSPQLAADLDLNGNDITGTGEIRIVGLVTATSAVKTWTLGASGSDHYTFVGDGFTSATNDPDIYLERGKRYAFLNNAGTNHPFWIKTTPGTGTGNPYNTGVTNNGAQSGYVTFNVPWDAPAHLYYQCQAHGNMVGNIYIRGGAGNNTNVGVTTFSSTVTATEFVPTLAQLAHRNRIHNGGMTIAQRIGDTETTLTHNNWTQTVDRWKCYENTEAVITATRVHGSYPTAGTNPSSYSAHRLKVTTADTSIGSSQQFMFAQIIEGFNWQDLRWGTSAAKTVTLSFSVLATGASASNVTGTYCVQCTNPNSYNRAYIREYTIDAINVWKRVTLTFPGDTSGTWSTGTDPACRFAWFLAAGTDHHGSANSWGTFKATTSNQKNFLGYVNNFIFITDVQVEEGTVATPFETKPFTTELQLCQRYYVKDTMVREGSGYGVVTGALDSIVGIQVDFPVTMRTTPNLTLNGTTYRTGGSANAERISPTGFIWGRKQTGSGTFNGAAYATGGYEVSAEY